MSGVREETHTETITRTCFSNSSTPIVLRTAALWMQRRQRTEPIWVTAVDVEPDDLYATVCVTWQPLVAGARAGEGFTVQA